MAKEILANIDPEEIRVVILENGTVVDLVMERTGQRGLVGNIYRGRVENILPGMQAAFVNIGQDKNGFLYMGQAARGSEEELEIPLSGQQIAEGRPLLVQVAKDAVGTKGARLTTQITLAGRNLVLIPLAEYIGISRRIEEEDERDRLRLIAESIKPQGMGLIVRTVAEGKSERELQNDIDYLLRVWQALQPKIKHGSVPSLVYQDITLVNRIVRDLFTEDVEKIIVDDRTVFSLLQELLTSIEPSLADRVQLFSGTDIFGFYGLTDEFAKAAQRRISLKCGGYLVIDQTEALTVIDVNTGKFVGEINLADTVLKTNLDAAEEIARQLRLRDIGGIIIIDFIDMDDEDHRQLVLQQLQECLKRDRTKSNVLGITKLGFVEMTRKKARPDLQTYLSKECPCCQGSGRVTSEETAAIEIKRRLRQVIAAQPVCEAILIEMHPLVAAEIIGPNGSGLKKWEKETGTSLLIRGREGFNINHVRILDAGERCRLLKKAVPIEAGQVLDVLVEDIHQHQQDDGIARKDGFVITIEHGAQHVGEFVSVEILKKHATHAVAKLL